MGEEVAMPHIAYKGKKIYFSLLVSKRRRTITLRVKRNGTVAVAAPSYIKGTIVRGFVKKKAGWILEKQKYFDEMTKRYPSKEFESGETFLLHGRNYRLKIVKVQETDKPRYKVEGGRLMIFVDPQTSKKQKEIAREAIQDWYTIHTEKKVNAIISKYISALDVVPVKIKIVDQKSRWASCSKTRVLRFNWRLSIMPTSVLEYIVIHELCHLKVHNHSPRFWHIVKSVLPDYEKRRAWLRENGIIISLMF